MEGWIKIHRKIAKWEWWTDPNTAHLFLHLLLHANYEAGRWQGHDILPGQVVTGRKSLALNSGLSEQSVRTALERLKSTSEITIKNYNKFSIITVCHWIDYQEKQDPANQQVTSNQPAINQQVTTIKEDKKVRKKEKEEVAGAHDEPKTEYDDKLDEFRQHRKELKKPFTAKGEKIFRMKLNRLHAKGEDILAKMDEAMERGWLSIVGDDEKWRR